jgi:hypothetical protein
VSDRCGIVSIDSCWSVKEIIGVQRVMLKHSSSKTFIRKISFFVPASRLNEFTKRQVQNNPSLDVYEDNYEKINKYYSTNFINSQHNKLIYVQKPLAKFNNSSSKDFVSNSLDSIKFDFLENIEEDIISAPESSTKIEKLIQNIHYYLYDSDVRELYNILKLNINKFRYFKDHLSSFEISVIIKRLIYYNDSLNQRLKFISKNKQFLNDSNVIDEIKSLNSTSRAVYLSTKSILNGFSNNLNLSLYDYENIVLFYYNKMHLVKAIELISEIETKANDLTNGFYMTNALWLVKMDILSKTNTNFWKIFGESIYKINSNSNINSKYLYPHHSHNFQILVKRYESDKSAFSLSDNLSIINIIIKGLGKHCDIPSLDKLVESYWGIKIDRNTDKGIYLLEHFNIKRNVNDLIWPNEDILISLLFAYTKNGDFATAIEINNLILDKYNNKVILNSFNTVKYWELVLRCTGLFGDAVDKKIKDELQGDEILSNFNENSLLEIKYRLFDKVWEMSQNYIKFPTRDMIKLKIKYASSHELLKGLPTVFNKIVNKGYNKSNINLQINEKILHQYVHECCIELAHRGRFLEANQLIENFITSRQSIEQLKTMLADMQEVYARERVKKDEINRRVIDDDDDFELW